MASIELSFHPWNILGDSRTLIVSLYVPIYLQQFPSYSNRKCKKSPFSRIFVSSGDAPATMTQCVTWMGRQFSACQTTCSMCLSIFNISYTMRKSKNRYFYHIFVSPGDTPVAPGAITHECCMDGKRIRCLQIVSLHVPVYV